MEKSEFDSRQRQEILLFSTASIPTTRPKQDLIQWLPGALYTGVKRPGHGLYQDQKTHLGFRLCLLLLEGHSERVRHTSMFKQEMHTKFRLRNVMRKYHVYEVLLSERQTDTMTHILLEQVG